MSSPMNEPLKIKGDGSADYTHQHVEMTGSPADVPKVMTGVASQSRKMRLYDLRYKAEREVVSAAFWLGMLFLLFGLKALWHDHNYSDADAYFLCAVGFLVASTRRLW